ncbi:hypothetical protein D915_010269 [Fasciola hepatica]|uniref:Uncharacterized protein n=1 Tax=Fasciola hepatica TaxID=6192 RepID=A0A4E0RAR6_FASHE|nr:hypothetical protein D915_010269 [Fasciola hepatica]
MDVAQSEVRTLRVVDVVAEECRRLFHNFLETHRCASIPNVLIASSLSCSPTSRNSSIFKKFEFKRRSQNCHEGVYPET